MIGQIISQYKLVKKLGAGGMGEVYLAEDAKLKRKVALKFLPQEFTKNQDSKERFRREAQTAAALNHPNIITIHDINEHDGQTYIAMEYLEGQTLKEKMASVGIGGQVPSAQISNRCSPLPIDEIIKITLQICEGLDAAHKAAIIHRDIKPQNILIDKNGRVKILDFGLAKFKDLSMHTSEGTIIGTAAYLSPEQAEGKGIDYRTDIWSLGVVLYEMLTGDLPFKGETAAAMIHSIVNKNPDSPSRIRPDIPVTLEAIIQKALEKNPSKRYETVQKLADELKGLDNQGTSGIGKISRARRNRSLKRKVLRFSAIIIISMILIGLIYLFIISKDRSDEFRSIAVLPFINLSEEKKNEYFCDGITEDIITQISKIKELRVTSRTSAFHFKNQKKSVNEIARGLGVEALLGGSIRRQADRVRITARLTDTKNGTHLWAETYDRQLKDIFDIQSDVASRIAASLKIKLLPETARRIGLKPTENLQAYQFYLQGKFFWNQRTMADLQKAIHFFEKSIKEDPDFALSYSGIAETYVVMASHDLAPPQSVYPLAEEFALKALSHDSKLSQAYAALGGVKQDWTWDFAEADKLLQKAIYFNSSNATAYQWLAEYHFYRGDFRNALKTIESAEKLDPYSSIIRAIRAHIILGQEDITQALEILKGLIRDYPYFSYAHFLASYAFIQKGSYEMALAHAAKVNHPLFQDYLNFLIMISRQEIEKARSIFKSITSDLTKIDREPALLAILNALLGDQQESIRLYAKAIEQHDNKILWRYGVFRCQRITQNPLIKAMLSEAGLEK